VHLPPSPTHFELVVEQHWPDSLPFTVNIGRDCLVVTTARRILLMNIHTYQIFDPLPEPHCVNSWTPRHVLFITNNIFRDRQLVSAQNNSTSNALSLKHICLSHTYFHAVKHGSRLFCCHPRPRLHFLDHIQLTVRSGLPLRRYYGHLFCGRYMRSFF
jgi:hypothetical protein